MAKISKVLILSVLVLSLASAAFATTSRVIALANAAPYMNDDSDIFRWYGTVASYNNMVMAEAGQATGSAGDTSADYQALGFTKSLGKDGWLGVWGIFLLYNSVDDMSFFANSMFVDPFFGQPNPTGTPGTQGTLATPTTKFVLNWGKDLGEAFALGVMITNSNTSVETSPGSTDDMSYWTFGAGIRGDLGDNAYYDAVISFGTAGGDTLGGFDKGSSFDIAARVFWEWLDDLTLVPYLDYNNWDFSYVNVAASSGTKVTDFTLGMSANWDVNSNNMLLFATELEWLTAKDSKIDVNDTEENSFTILPKFYVALESDITSWLTTRVGAQKTMLNWKETQTSAGTTTEVTTTGPPSPGEDFEWTLGLGFHVGEWDVDAVLSHEAPFRVGYWITGYGSFDPDPPVGRISGTYRF